MIGNYWLFWTGYRDHGLAWSVWPHEAWRPGEHGGYFVAMPPEAWSGARQWFAAIEDEV